MNFNNQKSTCSLFVLLAMIFNTSFVISGTNDDPPEDSKKSGFIFIPAIFYTPETKFAGGASMIYYYRGDNDSAKSRPSTIQPTFIFTQKNQIIGSVAVDLYWQQETYRLNGDVSYKKFPDKFYGIGPETTDSMEEDFTPKTFAFFLNFYKKVSPGLNLGLLYEFWDESISETDAGGLLALGIIPGSAGGTVSGAGILVNRDTRDNIFYPTHGTFHQFSAAFFSGGIGSNFNFNRYILDLRKYYSLGTSSVLVFQGFASFITGNPPFQFLSRLGGKNIMRGYYEGRYRDKNALVFQTEFRQRVLGRFGLVGFLGLGKVADEISGLDLEDAKSSFGLGLRYLWSSSEGINIRIDFGFKGGTPGPYITINEAF